VVQEDEETAVVNRIFKEKKSSYAFVVNGEGVLKGYVTEGKVKQSMSEGSPPPIKQAAESLDHTLTVMDAFFRIFSAEMRKLPVVDHEHRIMGTISSNELNKHMEQIFSEEEKLSGGEQGND